MRFVLASLVAFALFFGCASTNISLPKITVPQNGIDCSDAFAKTQSFGLNVLDKSMGPAYCVYLSTANGWENRAGIDTQYKDTTMFCEARAGTNSGENVNYLYFSGFVIIKNSKNVDNTGVITSTENKEYLVTNLILKPIGQRTQKASNEGGWDTYFMDYEVVSAQCKVAEK